MPNTPEKKPPRDVLRAIFRRKTLFLLGASLFAIMAMIGSHYIPLKYTGEARFQRRLDSSESSQKNQNEIEAMRLTLEQNLVGTQAVQAAIESLGLDRGLPRGTDGKLTLRGEMERQEKIKELTKGLLVKWEGKSSLVDVISVSFTSSDPSLAQRLPNELVRNYINAEGDRIQERLKQSMDSLQTRVADCDVRLKEAAKQRLAFETEHAGMLPEDPGALQRTIEQITSEIEVVRRQQAVAQTKLSRLKAFQTATTGPSTKPVQEVRGPIPELKVLQDQLQEARHQLDIALTVNRMTKQHPTVIMLDKKIAQLEKQIAEAPKEAFQTIPGTGQTVVDDLVIQLSAAQAEVDVTEKDLERLQDRLSKSQAMMANFGPVRQKYLEIVKKHQELQDEYSQWNKSYLEVQMALSSEVAKTRTHLESIQAAETQIRPSFPALYMVLTLAIGGGLAFGAALVFLANTMDRSITTTDQATEHFELAVYGAVNEIVTTHDQRVRRFRRFVLIPTVSAVVLVTIALSGLSVFLWLDDPLAFKEWKAAPITYVFHHLTGSTGGWWGS